MAKTITGKITFANGMVAPGVEVRVFDQDAPGKGDDDLTITPGVSDAAGLFTVQFDPGRFLDFVNVPFLGLSRPAEGGQGGGLRLPDPLDILSPYLQFRYTIDGQEHTCHVGMGIFQSNYQLPDPAPIHFLPSQDGFRFPNSFRGFALPFTIPFLPDFTKMGGTYGLCGGMSAAASDFFLAGRPITQATDIPAPGTKLYQYLFRRAMDSFAMGESVLRFARWMALPDDGLNGVWRLTQAEVDKLRTALDQQRLAPIGLVVATGSTPQEITSKLSLNHQVLAYAYSSNTDGSVDFHVYDPNSPCSDSALVQTSPVQVGQTDSGPIYGVKCQAQGINIGNAVRGFFVMPYEPADPPKGL